MDLQSNMLQSNRQLRVVPGKGYQFDYCEDGETAPIKAVNRIQAKLGDGFASWFIDKKKLLSAFFFGNAVHIHRRRPD